MAPEPELNEDVLRVRPLRQQVVSTQDQAILDAGKSLLANSITTGRDFAKTMAPVCTGAITLYFVGLKVVAPNKSQFSVWDGLVVVVPAMAFVIASAFFVAAYTPTLKSISLNVLTDVSDALDAITVRQHRWNRNGLWVFATATTLSSIGLTIAMLRWQLPTKT